MATIWSKTLATGDIVKIDTEIHHDCGHPDVVEYHVMLNGVDIRDSALAYLGFELAHLVDSGSPSSPWYRRQVLTRYDWIEVYYALDTKATEIEQGEWDEFWEDDDPEAPRKWAAYLRNIMAKLGVDGGNMYSKDGEPDTVTETEVTK